MRSRRASNGVARPLNCGVRRHEPAVRNVKGTIGAEQVIVVGEPNFVESASPAHSIAVVFEDDGDTGYLYAVDRSDAELHILDASHIYNVADVVDRATPSKVVIMWSPDGLK